MCSPEEEALLQQEEVFLATLARINTQVLEPLLKAGESRSPMGRTGDAGWSRGPDFYLVGPSELQPLMALRSWPPVAGCSFRRGPGGTRL